MRKGKFRTAVCLCHDDEDPVQDGLAVTPSQMMSLQAEGMPISSQVVGATYNEGEEDPDFLPPLVNRRGLDFADYWEAEQDIRSAIKKSVKFKPAESKTE